MYFKREYKSLLMKKRKIVTDSRKVDSDMLILSSMIRLLVLWCKNLFKKTEK